MFQAKYFLQFKLLNRIISSNFLLLFHAFIDLKTSFCQFCSFLILSKLFNSQTLLVIYAFINDLKAIDECWSLDECYPNYLNPVPEIDIMGFLVLYFIEVNFLRSFNSNY